MAAAGPIAKFMGSWMTITQCRGTRIFVDPSLQCILGIQEAITKLRWICARFKSLLFPTLPALTRRVRSRPWAGFFWFQ